MANKSYFSSIGIAGWDNLEGIILAAILGNKSVLLNGPHGSNKTEGCQRISEAVFGEETKFVPYDTSLVNADDLLGYPNPKAMSEGRIEYIETPDCIWSATSCLLDEINRCNPYNAAKFFEIVRSRTINGRPTGLEFVWAACNPPDKYNTAHMDAAQVSRFVVLQVPPFNELTKEDKKTVLLSGAKNVEPGKLRVKIEKARKSKVPTAQRRAIEKKVMKIAETLNKKNVQFSGRQTKDLYTLFMNMDRISRVFEGICLDLEVLTSAVMGLVPECTGLIRSSINRSPLEAEIAGILHGFKLSDPILTAETLTDLCTAEVKDAHGHAAAIIDMLKQETNSDVINKSWEALKNRIDISPDIYEKIRQAFVARSALLSLPEDAKIGEAVKEISKQFKCYGFEAEGRSKQ